MAATCGGVRVHSVYVPNGREVGGEHYEAKLAWLEELRSYLDRTCKPTDPVAVCGDFNIAPDDRDIYDRAALEGSTHITEPERQALRMIEDWGLVDAFRLLYDRGGLFSWWDYRAGNFHKHLGMRIDLVLLSHVLAETVHLRPGRPQRPQGEAALGPCPGLRRRHRRERPSTVSRPVSPRRGAVGR